MKRSKVVKYENVDLPDGRRMKSAEEDGYKYLGILQYNEVLHAEMKIRLQNEYYRRLKRILKSKLNGMNVIIAVNTWAMSVLRYEARVISWTKAELESIDRKARKQMIIYGMLHPHTDVQRLYLPRGQGGSGLKSVYARSLMVAVAKEGLPLKEKTLTQKQLKEQKELERAEGWKSKPLHGQFLHQTEEIRDDATWDWHRKGDLKKENEGMITAAQDEALRTNAIKAKVEKQKLSPFCRMCGEKDKSVGHLVAECSKQPKLNTSTGMIMWLG